METGCPLNKSTKGMKRRTRSVSCRCSSFSDAVETPLAFLSLVAFGFTLLFRPSDLSNFSQSRNQHHNSGVTRERLFACILVPLIAGVAYIVWKGANDVNHPKPASAAAAAQPVDQAPPMPVTNNVLEGTAYEEIPKDRSPVDADIITHAKDTPVSMLDSSLPHESADYWIAHAAGSAARVRWDANNCPGAGKDGNSMPVCAEANIEFSNGIRFQTLIMVGEQALNPRGPVQYGQPSMLWAAYQKPRGALTPADLPFLRQIAQQAN